MDRPSELILHDVRCFQGEQRGCLKPITLLVGENSTGKTTFLGCYAVLNQIFKGREIETELDFNIEPFSMGSFRDVVRFRRGRSGLIDQFKLGLTYSFPTKNDRRSYQLLATFEEDGSQPIIASLRFQFDKDSFLEVQPNGEDTTMLKIPKTEVEIDASMADTIHMTNMSFSLGWESYYYHNFESEEKAKKVFSYLNKIFFPDGNLEKEGAKPKFFTPELPGLFPVAPLRSRPKRTYDPVRETISPSGEHVPMLMMRLDHSQKRRWNSLHDDLVRFGNESGLFSDIKIKRHGRQMSDPFQLQVKVQAASHANLMDVGYGVSQSLPILVDVLASGQEPRVFLMQQPEVHLHPRGQAELANLFVDSFKRHGNQFLIETHSDYIIDRVRIAVRKEVVDADDVSILYFEPKGNTVRIHNITLDRDGNIENAPPEYRTFFLKETDQLLGFGN